MKALVELGAIPYSSFYSNFFACHETNDLKISHTVSLCNCIKGNKSFMLDNLSMNNLILWLFQSFLRSLFLFNVSSHSVFPKRSPCYHFFCLKTSISKNFFSNVEFLRTILLVIFMSAT